jgi:hypothetical protein
MNQLHLQNAKTYLQETHARAYCDYLARSLQPSFRQRLATLLTNVALRLQGNPQTNSSDLAPFSG